MREGEGILTLVCPSSGDLLQSVPQCEVSSKYPPGPQEGTHLELTYLLAVLV